MEASSLVTKARSALHSAASKAEKVLTDFKCDFINDREYAGRRVSDASERDPDNEIAENGIDPKWRHELKNLRWKTTGRGAQKNWQDKFRNFRRRNKQAENTEKSGDIAMAFQIFDKNMYQMCMKDVFESKDSEVPSEDFSRFNILDAPSLAPIMRQLAVAVEAGKKLKSVKDFMLPGNTSPLREKSGLSLTVMKSLVLGEREETSGRKHKNDKKIHTLMELLLNAEEQGSEPVTREELNDTISLARDIHGAPPKSFVVKLAEAIGSFKTLQKMEIFWREFVNELRELWCDGKHLPCIPFDEVPDLNYCLLYQQLQVINCCVSRKRRRSVKLQSLDSAINGGYISTEKLCVYGGAMPSSPLIYARINTGELVLRLGIDRQCDRLTMLETGEPMYSPVTQEIPLLTEDVIRETEELVLRTRSVGAGCSQLFSDMQAFKAANPGSILEDFVRWHSPPDWTEADGSDVVEGTSQVSDAVSSRGQLSNRMQKQGNLWRELWETARPVPAVKQTPLFDEDLTVEGILRNLEDIPPSHLFQQLFLSLLGLGLANAERMLSKDDHLSELFSKCKDYVTLTCQTTNWDEKLGDLCQVYETVDMMVLNPEEVLKMMNQQNGSGEMKRRFKGFVLNFGGKDKHRKTVSKDQNAPRENAIYQPLSTFFNVKAPVFRKKPTKGCGGHNPVQNPDPCPENSPLDESDWTVI